MGIPRYIGSGVKVRQHLAVSCLCSLSIYAVAPSHSQYKYRQYVVMDIAHDSTISHSIPPQRP